MMKRRNATLLALVIGLCAFLLTAEVPGQAPSDYERAGELIRREHDIPLPTDYKPLSSETEGPFRLRLAESYNRSEEPVFLLPGVDRTYTQVFLWEALPIGESDLIVAGVTLSRQSHLSANSSEIFTEWNVRVEEVLSSKRNVSPTLRDRPEVVVGDEILVHRVGGAIRYSDGREIVSEKKGYGYPFALERCLFFLSSDTPIGYGVKAVYLIRNGLVFPLDTYNRKVSGLGTWPFNGSSEDSFRHTLRKTLK